MKIGQLHAYDNGDGTTTVQRVVPGGTHCLTLPVKGEAIANWLDKDTDVQAEMPGLGPDEWEFLLTGKVSEDLLAREDA